MGLVYADITLINGDDLALVRRGYMGDDKTNEYICSCRYGFSITCY